MTRAFTSLSPACLPSPGAEVRYSITGGNRDGLFTIDQRTGIITLAAALDYEISDEVREGRRRWK